MDESPTRLRRQLFILFLLLFRGLDHLIVLGFQDTLFDESFARCFDLRHPRRRWKSPAQHARLNRATGPIVQIRVRTQG